MNKYLINVKGKNIKNFLLRIAKKKINLLNITFVSDDEVNILIYKKDIDSLNENKGIYDYKIIKEYGIMTLKKTFLNNLHLVILIILNIILIFHISTYIYEVEILEDNQELKRFLTEVLEKKGITKHKKKPTNLEKIKEEILNENANRIEWLEIIESGVKYIIKAEERIENKKFNDMTPSNIIAKKDGLIKELIVSSGKVLVEKETFVKKGEILVTGIIDGYNFVRSKGKVYANTWYKVSASQPLHESNYSLTNNQKSGFKIKFFNKEFLFYKEYSTNKVEEKIIFKNPILPFYLAYDQINETKIVDHILTIEEAKTKAIEKARAKIESKLKKDEKIISENELKVKEKDSKIIVEVLFTVYENISLEERIEVLNVQGNNRSSN